MATSSNSDRSQMTKRTLGVALATVAVVAAVPAAGSAVTTKTTTPRIEILGGATIVVNRYVKDLARYNKDVYQVKSGATIQIRSKTPDEPHTVSVVGKSDLVKSLAGFDKCYEGGVCGSIYGSHGYPEGGDGPPGPPATPLVNKGASGFNTKGDSVALGDKASFKLTATKGRTLYLMCVIHPQMQAKISVK